MIQTSLNTVKEAVLLCLQNLLGSLDYLMRDMNLPILRIQTLVYGSEKRDIYSGMLILNGSITGQSHRRKLRWTSKAIISIMNINSRNAGMHILSAKSSAGPLLLSVPLLSAMCFLSLRLLSP